MKSILFLVHRLPYPPNKGDKITSYNILKYFSSRYGVYLGCFVDDRADWQYVEHVKSFCKETCIVDLNPVTAKVSSLRGLLTGEPLSLPYYRSTTLRRWVEALIDRACFDGVLIFSGVMAQYVSGKLDRDIRTVLDLEDVDSDKWRLYAREHPWPMNWLYRRESKYLLAFEKKMADEFDSTVFVSREEADFFKTLAPSVSEKIVHRVQGIDGVFFDPVLRYESPYPSEYLILAFIGAMDYWPNANAAVWFAHSVFPEIRKKYTRTRFYIVGMNPGEEVRQLAGIEGVFVTGGVADIRPYIAHADVIVVPLRLARGIQNKVLEAMAMERPVLATSYAMQGIIPYTGFTPLVADDEQALLEGALALLSGNAKQNLEAGRACVLAHYNWDTNLRSFESLLRGER
ncbi:MAG: TIGR03087 family PEP-CTERM/XrtA system glycosyltransferase [Methylococcales bacterium]